MDEIEIINQLERDLLVWDRELFDAIMVVNGGLQAELDKLISELALNGLATTRAESMANLSRVTMFIASLPDLISEIGMQTAVRTLIDRMGQSADVLNSYYSALDNSFSATAYRPLLEALAEQTLRLLTGPAVEMAYVRPLNELLSWSVISKSTAAELRTALRNNLATGVPARSIHQQASDALYTFSRGYSMAAAEGLGLKHYYYMGTQIVTTRTFCSTRIGKAFTEKEVESWAGLTWPGKNPATTVKTIFWYCGGYNCRHRLLPVSKQFYNQLTTQNNG